MGMEYMEFQDFKVLSLLGLRFSSLGHPLWTPRHLHSKSASAKATMVSTTAGAGRVKLGT